MKRRILLAMLASLALVVVWPVLAADKVLTIKEIMGKLNKPGGLRPNLGQDLKADEPDWELIQSQTKEFAALATGLGKNKPPIGDAASWQRLTTAYAADAAALDAAAKKMDKAATLAAHARLSTEVALQGMS